jgi:hypothetical protein
VELGEEFAHVELILDPGLGTITAYVLDGEAEQAVRIAQTSLAIVLDGPTGLANRSLELLPRASVLTGERVGDASEFALSHDALRGLRRVTGRLLTITVRGRTFHETRCSAEPPEAPAASTH